MKYIHYSLVVLAFICSAYAHEKATEQSLVSALSSRKKSLASLRQYEPLLVVTIMVKNEAQVIERTLQPFINAGMQHFLVLDTGSTDDTIAVIKNFFAQHGIRHGIIKEEPFVDYATSRNRTLTLARDLFPNACFMIMPDAEWIMHDVETLVTFCKQHQHETAGGYPVRIVAGDNLDYPNHRLVRCASDAHFVSPLHEYLVGTQLSEERVPPSAFFEWTLTSYGAEKSKKRWVRDREYFLTEHKKHPEDGRTVFYLAQTYECLDEIDKAILYYDKRAHMHGWDEETFMAFYRLAKLYEKNNQWDKALHAYMEAYVLRPHRAEPLIRIAAHYVNSDHFAAGFLFASRAAEIPYPTKDTLFIEKQQYDYERYDLLARSAWYLNEFEVGEQAAELTVAGAPQAFLENAKSNLAFYKSRKPGGLK